jgi:putative phosphoribosyl transferase
MSVTAPYGTPRDLRIGHAPALSAFLAVPPTAKGLVIFAHGSGSGRLSPRNNYVAERLRESGLATLLLDLLIPSEEVHRRNVFDIPLLASRLRLAADWAEAFPETAGLRPCYFGASTGPAPQFWPPPTTTVSGPSFRVAAGPTSLVRKPSLGSRRRHC